jgi:hypothetical protein
MAAFVTLLEGAIGKAISTTTAAATATAWLDWG